MNKYQEALDYINKSICTLLALQGIQDEQVIINLHILQELVDKLQDLQDSIDSLEKLEKVIDILKRIYIFKFTEETIYNRKEWLDCYYTSITQEIYELEKEEYNLLKEVFKNG